MFDFNTLAEFSRNHCVALCAFLVPANLITTSLTILLSVFHRWQFLQVWQSAAIAGFFAALMLLHVFTWFAVGVVLAPTYILMCLAGSCLLTNLGAVIFTRRYIIKHPITAQ